MYPMPVATPTLANPGATRQLQLPDLWGIAVDLTNFDKTHLDGPFFTFGDKERHARDDRFLWRILVIILNIVP